MDAEPRVHVKASRDGDNLVAWVREAADELEKAHAILDSYGAPRSVPGTEPVECTLAARIALLYDQQETRWQEQI